MKHQLVVILDFGGQDAHLIARQVRDCGVFCEVKPDTLPPAELAAMRPVGIILNGGADCPPEILALGIPTLQAPAENAALEAFLKSECGCVGDWNMSDYVEQTIAALRTKIGDKKVVCALSGGVDSTVSAVMVHRAVGHQLTCLFVDHGVLRKNEADQVEQICKERFQMNLIRVDARAEFLGKLAGVTDPEQKRRIIGETFIRVFERESKKLGKVEYLVQGTIYPDVIESGTGHAKAVKSHHNVGGMPKNVDFEEVIEPVRMLFKDEVRRAGLALGIDESLVWRQPFPGPGLAVRVLGEVTPERVAMLQEADAIFREEIALAGLEREISQYFAILTNVRAVGVADDGRTYNATVALRAVKTTDFMTAEVVQIPYELLTRTAERIINEVPGIGRVVYDVTQKPPGTIEWE